MLDGCGAEEDDSRHANSPDILLSSWERMDDRPRVQEVEALPALLASSSLAMDMHTETAKADNDIQAVDMKLHQN